MEEIRTAKIIEGKTNKTPHKALEGIRTAKIIEGKTNKIPYKALEGIRTAKISNIYYILFFIIMK